MFFVELHVSCISRWQVRMFSMTMLRIKSTWMWVLCQMCEQNKWGNRKLITRFSFQPATQKRKTNPSTFLFCLGKKNCHSRRLLTLSLAGVGGSVGCAVRLETRRSRVQPPPRSATFFLGDWSWNIFYGHSLPSPDSRRAFVSCWRKNVHNTGQPLRGLSLPSKRVVR